MGMHRGEDAEFHLRKGFRVIGFDADCRGIPPLSIRRDVHRSPAKYI